MNDNEKKSGTEKSGTGKKNLYHAERREMSLDELREAQNSQSRGRGPGPGGGGPRGRGA